MSDQGTLEIGKLYYLYCKTPFCYGWLTEDWECIEKNAKLSSGDIVFLLEIICDSLTPVAEKTQYKLLTQEGVITYVTPAVFNVKLKAVN